MARLGRENSYLTHSPRKRTNSKTSQEVRFCAKLSARLRQQHYEERHRSLCTLGGRNSWLPLTPRTPRQGVERFERRGVRAIILPCRISGIARKVPSAAAMMVTLCKLAEDLGTFEVRSG